MEEKLTTLKETTPLKIQRVKTIVILRIVHDAVADGVEVPAEWVVEELHLEEGMIEGEVAPTRIDTTLEIVAGEEELEEEEVAIKERKSDGTRIEEDIAWKTTTKERIKTITSIKGKEAQRKEDIVKREGEKEKEVGEGVDLDVDGGPAVAVVEAEERVERESTTANANANAM